MWEFANEGKPGENVVVAVVASRGVGAGSEEAANCCWCVDAAAVSGAVVLNRLCGVGGGGVG